MVRGVDPLVRLGDMPERAAVASNGNRDGSDIAIGRQHAFSSRATVSLFVGSPAFP